MNTSDIVFLAEVRAYCDSPKRLQSVIEAAVSGLSDKMEQVSQQSADMEIVANIAMHDKLFKGKERFLADKLEKWNGRTAVIWDDVIDKLRNK